MYLVVNFVFHRRRENWFHQLQYVNLFHDKTNVFELTFNNKQQNLFYFIYNTQENCFQKPDRQGRCHCDFMMVG